ncbi:hypothetical protein IK146_03500 [Candidatus Saccharibacteria bacterium]|nr:hypothetical protein [Candidatus Saccharibacteria bacterium]
MSRILSISGNFVQFGRWSEPDPSFSGKIVVNEKDEFFGFCDELYRSDMSDINRIRYIAGAFAPNGRNGARGIAFYKMSNDPEQSPLMYVVPDLTNPESGSWAALSIFGYFQEQGKSKVIVTEEVYSEEEENRIKAEYCALDKGINGNDELLEQIHCCKDIITHAT